MLIKKFEEQVEKEPGKIAIKAGRLFLSYDRLNRDVNRVALILTERWPEDRKNNAVGLFLEHGPQMIAAILGTLKAGKIYVPLSTGYPENRLSYILSNSQSSLIVTNPENEERAKSLSAKTGIELLVIDKEAEAVSEHNPERELFADEPAYIMYTSGSTGRPKGVTQIHKNILYYTRNWTRVFAITSADNMTLFSSFCHDGSVQDLFGALLNGATLFPVSIRDREEAFELSEFLVKEKITIWHSVPSLYSYFTNTLTGLEQFKYLRLILLGGEAVREHEILMFKKYFPHSLLANVYGQTESSVDSIRLIGQDDSFDEPLIGEPLDETTILVVDEDGDEVDILHTGEIVIACPYISPGYWKNEEASGTAFSEDEELGRLYWTGDRGRLLPGGGIVFMGRQDHQVKIRGFRIELGEIETRLLAHEDIKEAVVLLKSNGPEDKLLTAYYVADSEVPGTLLREFLARELPDYMVPTFYMKLQSFPLTQSGKIDRKALPEPEAKSSGAYVAPRDDVEKRLAAIWSEVLGTTEEKVGIDDNFFELGGHSLKATRLVYFIRRDFEVNFSLKQVFDNPCIRGLARSIKTLETSEYAAVTAVEKREYYEPSYNQKRLWVLHQLDPLTPAFNMSSRFELKHKVDIKAFKKTLSELMKRHDSLRTKFGEVDEEPVQIILKQVEMPFKEIDISTLSEEAKKKESDRIFREISTACFTLTLPPLFRAALIKLAGKHYEFIYNLHHIITDGSSMEIIKHEFLFFYEVYREDRQEGLPLTGLQYKDFCRWSNERIKDPVFKKQSHSYWQAKLAGGIPALELPARSSGDKESLQGAAYMMMINRKLSERLKKLASDSNTTLFVVMFSLYNMMLYRFSKQQDIACSIISAGREHLSLQNIIGFFVNSLLFRIEMSPGECFSDFLQRMQTSALETFQHQGYPLELVCRDMKLKYPEIPVSFNMLNIREAGANPRGGSFESYHLEEVQDVKFDIEPYIAEYPDGIYMYWVYKRSLFKPENIEHIVDEYIKLIDFFTGSPYQSYDDFRDRVKKKKFKIR